MATEKVSYPQSERSRYLQQVAFVASSVLSRDLPRDTVLKSLAFRLSGSVVTTFASGTPVADALSTFDNLISRIDVIVNGSRTVKSVFPRFMRFQQLLSTNILGERRSSAGAAASVYPTTDGAFVYGTTTQITSVAETIMLSFEQVYCDPGLGRESTWLNLKGVASAEVRLTTNAFSSLLGFGNTAPVVFSANLLVIDIVTREAQDVPPQILFSDWKQTCKQITFSAQQTGAVIDINRGNSLSGIVFYCQDGAAGSASTSTGKLANNTALTDIQLLLNGQTSIKRIPGLAFLNASNRAEFGILAAMASGVSILDGVGYMNLLARKDLSTALPLKPPQVDNAQLVINTDNSTNVSYTNPITVSMMTEEVVEPR